MTHAERAFLQLAARRELQLRLNYAKGAESFKRETELECGALARLEFHVEPEKKQLLFLRPRSLPANLVTEVAEEIFGHPPTPVPSNEDGLYLFERRYP